MGYALSVGGSEAITVLSWSLAATMFFLLTLSFLSVALKTIDVGIGYAVWAGIGSVGAALFASALLDQSLTLGQGVWLAVIILGVIWLKLADSPRLQRAMATRTEARPDAPSAVRRAALPAHPDIKETR